MSQATPTHPDEAARETRHRVRGVLHGLKLCVAALVVTSVSSAREGQRASRSDDDAAEAAPDIEQPFKVAKERVIAEFEKVYLERLMLWAQGNVSRAARKAKIDRMYLHRLLQRYATPRDSQPDR